MGKKVLMGVGGVSSNLEQGQGHWLPPIAWQILEFEQFSMGSDAKEVVDGYGIHLVVRATFSLVIGSKKKKTSFTGLLYVRSYPYK